MYAKNTDHFKALHVFCYNVICNHNMMSSMNKLFNVIQELIRGTEMTLTVLNEIYNIEVYGTHANVCNHNKSLKKEPENNERNPAEENSYQSKHFIAQTILPQLLYF